MQIAIIIVDMIVAGSWLQSDLVLLVGIIVGVSGTHDDSTARCMITCRVLVWSHSHLTVIHVGLCSTGMVNNIKESSVIVAILELDLIMIYTFTLHGEPLVRRTIRHSRMPSQLNARSV